MDYLASLNKIKKASFSRYRSHMEWDPIFQSVSSSSDVSEQPIGLQEIKLGCTNRCYNAARQLGLPKDKSDRVYAIENGIIIEAEGAYDIPMVAVFKPATGEIFYALGRKCCFPYKLVKVFIDNPELKKILTVGKILESVDLVTDHADPHVDLIGTPREDILFYALCSLTVPN